MNKLLLCLILLLNPSILAFDIYFGIEEKQISAIEDNEHYSVKLPYPILIRNKQMFLLDPIQQKIVIFQLDGKFEKVISLNCQELEKHHPIDSFAHIKDQLFFLVSRKTRSLILHDATLQKTRLISSADDEQIVLYPTEVQNYRHNYFVTDAILKRIAIYSQSGNLLGSLPYDGVNPFPYSSDEILYFEKTDHDPRRLYKKDMSGKIIPFADFDQTDAELLQMKFIGMDEENNLYFEKIIGETHGVPDLYAVKTDLFGQIVLEQKVNLSANSFYDFTYHFLLIEKNRLLQIIWQDDRLTFTEHQLFDIEKNNKLLSPEHLPQD